MSTYRELPAGSSFRVCRKMIRDMMRIAFSYTVVPEDRATSHLHLKTPISGIVLSDQWQKIDIGSSNFTRKIFDGFTFDSDNDRVYWDADGSKGESLSAFFVGAAGLQVTAGVGIGVTISMGLFIDGNLILETPLSFSAIDKIQMYGANGILVDAQDEDLLQPGSYYELFSKAGTGETPTVTVNSLNTTIKKD